MTDHCAKHLIIGGGIIGCSIAYHLARAGENDIVLLEKASFDRRSNLARSRLGRATAFFTQYYPHAAEIRRIV